MDAAMCWRAARGDRSRNGDGEMAWCKLEDTFRDHRKPKRLASKLGINRREARGLVAGLWSWATGQAPDGDLRDFTQEEIAEGADWDGDAAVLIAAMSDPEVNLLDHGPSGLSIHGFKKRQGSYKEAQRKSRQRKKKNGTAGPGTPSN